MDNTEYATLLLVRSGLLGEKCKINPQIDWSKLYSISFHHGIIGIVYNAIKLSNIDVPAEYLRLFQIETLNYVRKDYHQRSEIRKIFQAFEENGIRYIPLKGIIMKNMYPNPEYRWMSDADIFIDKSQLEEISKLMKDLGYTHKGDSLHDFTWEKDELFHVELHILAWNPKYKLIDDYFKNPFSMANNVNGMQYQYNSNDMLLFAICHMMKHFINEIGNLRNIIDVHYLLQAQDLDISYVNRKLREWKLDSFFEVVRKSVNDWFGTTQFDKTEALFLGSVLNKTNITEHKWAIISHLAKSDKNNNQKLGKHRFRDIFILLFPPYTAMKQGYDILNRFPILLPFMWIRRLMRGILFRRNITKNYVDVYFGNSNTYVDQYIKLVSVVGLKDMLSSEE